MFDLQVRKYAVGYDSGLYNDDIQIMTVHYPLRITDIFTGASLPAATR